MAGWVRARAPATIANVGPGFDVFCLAVRGPSDEVALRPAERDSLQVEGLGADTIPGQFSENTAGIVIDALRDATGIEQSIAVRVRKGIPAGRGLGSSAASCAAAAIAFLRAFPQSKSLGVPGFIRAAVEGEAAVAGRHYDNVAGALLGGFVTVASGEPLILAREPVSPRVSFAVAIPEVVLRTAEMRKVLPEMVTLRDAVANVGRAATLALALSRGDVSLAGRCLEDRLAEPARARFLPGSPEARAAALAAGAAGFAVSGSGSSVFALASNRRIAGRAARAMCDAFEAQDIPATPLVTSVDNAVPLGPIAPRSGHRFSIVGAQTPASNGRSSLASARSNPKPRDHRRLPSMGDIDIRPP
jgi:homoserine kinase